MFLKRFFKYFKFQYQIAGIEVGVGGGRVTDYVSNLDSEAFHISTANISKLWVKSVNFVNTWISLLVMEQYAKEHVDGILLEIGQLFLGLLN